MKEHIKRIVLAMVSICVMLLLVFAEFDRENIQEEVNLFFLVDNEVIRTWENNGVQY